MIYNKQKRKKRARERERKKRKKKKIMIHSKNYSPLKQLLCVLFSLSDCAA